MVAAWHAPTSPAWGVGAEIYFGEGEGEGQVFAPKWEGRRKGRRA